MAIFSISLPDSARWPITEARHKHTHCSTISPAIDAGDPNITFDANEFDQRGAPFVRVFDDPDPTATGTGIDIGAFERMTLSEALIVDNRVDENDGDFSSGDLSLREAISITNGSVGADTITFDEDVFNGGDDNIIRLTQGELRITEQLTVDGTSVGGVLVTGDADDDDVTLPGTHITDVSASFGGFAGATDDLLDDNSRVLRFSLSWLQVSSRRASGIT